MEQTARTGNSVETAPPPHETPHEKPGDSGRAGRHVSARWPWRTLLLAALVSALVIVPFVLFGTAVESWTRAFVANAAEHRVMAALVLGGLLVVDVVAPVPSSLVSTACGTLLGFPLGWLVSSVAMTVSAVAGYLVGRAATPGVRRLIGHRELALLERLYARWGIWVLAVLRPVPVLAEASVVFAGLARVPRRVGFLALVLSNMGISAVYAAVGATAARHHAFLSAFLAALLLPGLVLALSHRLRSRGWREG